MSYAELTGTITIELAEREPVSRRLFGDADMQRAKERHATSKDSSPSRVRRAPMDGIQSPRVAGRVPRTRSVS